MELFSDFFHVLYAAIFTVVLYFYCHPTFVAYYSSVNGSLYRSALLSISEMELSIVKAKQIGFFFLELVCALPLCTAAGGGGGMVSIKVSPQKIKLVIQSEGLKITSD